MPVAFSCTSDIDTGCRRLERIVPQVALRRGCNTVPFLSYLLLSAWGLQSIIKRERLTSNVSAQKHDKP